MLHRGISIKGFFCTNEEREKGGKIVEYEGQEMYCPCHGLTEDRFHRQDSGNAPRAGHTPDASASLLWKQTAAVSTRVVFLRAQAWDQNRAWLTRSG